MSELIVPGNVTVTSTFSLSGGWGGGNLLLTTLRTAVQYIALTLDMMKKQWVRVGRKSSAFRTTLKDGPRWSDATRRVTEDAKTWK